MAATPSNALITSVLNSITGDTPYIALYTNNPTAADTGTEVTGGSYVRKSVSFGSITSGSVSNVSSITFSGMPNTTVSHWGIKNASTGGTLKVFGAFTTPIVLQAGDDITIGVGQLTVSLSGS